MGVQVVRQEPTAVPEPVVAVTLTGPNGRAVIVRPTTTGGKRAAVRTIEVRDAHDMFAAKWAATLGDLRTFGQALIDIADGK